MGELRERKRISLPVLAGVGGMAVPVLIYLAFNRSGDAASGWGIAMSTDTAFALGVLAVVGRRAPATAARLPAHRRGRGRRDRPDRDRGRSTPRTCAPLALLIGAGLLVAVHGRALARRAARPAVRRARRRGLGGRAGVGRRPRHRRPGDRPHHLGVPAPRARPGAGDAAVPRLPRAADVGAGPRGPPRPRRSRSRPTSGCSRCSTRGRATWSCRCSPSPTPASRSTPSSCGARPRRRSRSASSSATWSASRSASSPRPGWR